MTITVAESRDLPFFDSVVNADGVYDGAADDTCPAKGKMSLESLTTKAGNIFLKIFAYQVPMGFFNLIRMGPGLYEVHTLILPEFRRWALRATKVGKEWMFCTTDAQVLSTFAWSHAKNVRWLACASGMREEATRPHAATVGGFPVKRVLYTLHLAEWARTACLDFTDDGKKFYGQVATQLGIEIPPDENRDAMTGLAIAMAHGGQIDKAQTLFNRWAAIHGFRPTQFIGRRGDALLLNSGGGFWAVKPNLETFLLERSK